MTGARALSVVAVTDDRLARFGPYVPALDDEGRVTFQATLDDGTSTVLTTVAGGVVELLDPALVGAVTSHPDVERGTATSFYATLLDGTHAVCAVLDGALHVLAGAGDGLVAVGPAGPTANGSGAVAFRADDACGPGAFVVDEDGMRRVAGPDDALVAFHGLPVLDAAGRVLVRATRADGVEGVYRRASGRLETVVETGEVFTTLGLFPCASDDGTVAFAAATPDEGSVVAVATADGGVTIVDAQGAFASFRGALVAGDGHVVRLATPLGGALGLFDGPDPRADRILAIGDPLLGSSVVDLAANPVSIDRAGNVAIRVGLADGREAIVVAERAR
jgi:hypothetical protein